MAPATSPSSEDKAMWPPSKLEAKPLRSASGMGSPGMPVSARAPGGGTGGTQERWDHRAQLEAWKHGGELGVPCGVCVSLGEDPFLLWCWGSTGTFGEQGTNGGTAPTAGSEDCHLTGGLCPPRAHKEGGSTGQRWQQASSTFPKCPTSTQR